VTAQTIQTKLATDTKASDSRARRTISRNLPVRGLWTITPVPLLFLFPPLFSWSRPCSPDPFPAQVALEHLDPMGEDYLDKLGHLKGAVQTHVYQEENDWFVHLKENAPTEDQRTVTARYEEYGR
jgi:hypothetical protein